jgi:hypothetical protein
VTNVVNYTGPLAYRPSLPITPDMPSEQASPSAPHRWLGILVVMAVLDIASVSTMLWRNDRRAELLIAGLNMGGIVACLAFARLATGEKPPASARIIDVQTDEVGSGRTLPRPPRRNSAGGPGLTGFVTLTSASDATATLEDFPSELEAQQKRRAG